MSKKTKLASNAKSRATKQAKRGASGVPTAGPFGALAAGAAGAAAGGIFGAMAGPPGAIIGAILGAGAGAGSEMVGAGGLTEKRKHNAELDREIGVVGGNVGEASPSAPTSRRGAFSAASLGVSSVGSRPSGGPISRGDA